MHRVDLEQIRELAELAAECGIKCVKVDGIEIEMSPDIFLTSASEASLPGRSEPDPTPKPAFIRPQFVKNRPPNKEAE